MGGLWIAEPTHFWSGKLHHIHLRYSNFSLSIVVSLTVSLFYPSDHVSYPVLFVVPSFFDSLLNPLQQKCLLLTVQPGSSLLLAYNPSHFFYFARSDKDAF